MRTTPFTASQQSMVSSWIKGCNRFIFSSPDVHLAPPPAKLEGSLIRSQLCIWSLADCTTYEFKAAPHFEHQLCCPTTTQTMSPLPSLCHGALYVCSCFLVPLEGCLYVHDTVRS
mmetsp:Transcript_36586/g.61168  ORF Transcript_36586/g.61168 Transcript_36586/m.61168 type:complete len:115 (-) Transcript_36586:110-454(-)